MLKKIVFGLGLVLAGFLAVTAAQPDEYRVVRTAAINAEPAKVFALINDFHNWDKWSPWAKLDPAMKATYSGAEAGTGAVYDWTGNSDVGKGRMTISESQPGERVLIRLEFIEPFASVSDTEFRLKAESGGTRVEWAMSGRSSFLEKGMCLLMGGMDRMIGKDFEKGLSQMKAAAEASGR